MPRRQQAESLAGAFDGLRSDYAAAKSSRFRRRRTGLPSAGSGADYHYASESDYLRMMEYSRDMDRNDCIVGQMIDRAVTNCVQDGFTLDPQTGDKGLDTELWNRFHAWANDPDECDLEGEKTFDEMAALALRQHFVDGDILALPTEEGSLQLVEAHRLRTPRNTTRNVVHGVLLDANRKRTEYWLTKNDVAPLKSVAKVNEITAYPARDRDGNRQVYHLYNPKRATQTRGVTAFAPMFDLCGMFEDVNFAKLVQQQVVSCFAVIRQMESEGTAGGLPPRGEETEETLSDGSTRLLQGIAPGMEIRGRPGETIEGFSPAVPNPEFFDHVRLLLTLIGINVGMPLVLVLLDASETNFSGFRGALDQARLGFRRNQKMLRVQVKTPVYHWKLREWIATDAAMRSVAQRTGININGHRWNAPQWPYIEPLKDASADLLRVRNALISPRRLHAERGRDWEELAGEIVQDNAYAIRLAKAEAEKLNSEFPSDDQRVHWRELLSLPTPDGVTVTLTPTQEADDAE